LVIVCASAVILVFWDPRTGVDWPQLAKTLFTEMLIIT